MWNSSNPLKIPFKSRSNGTAAFVRRSLLSRSCTSSIVDQRWIGWRQDGYMLTSDWEQLHGVFGFSVQTRFVQKKTPQISLKSKYSFCVLFLFVRLRSVRSSLIFNDGRLVGWMLFLTALLPALTKPLSPEILFKRTALRRFLSKHSP